MTDVADLYVVLRAKSGELVKGFGTAEGAAGRFDGAVGKAYKGLATFGLGVAAAGVGIGVAATNSAAKFQAAMELIRTQAGYSQAQVDSMSQSVLNLAGPTGQAPMDLAAGLYHLASATKDPKKAMAELKVAAEGAKVGHANLEDVTNALNAAVVSGIPGVQDLNQAMGAMNATVGAGDMKMQDLADAFGSGMLASVKGFGLSMNDVGAALATFGDNNIRGADAATQLRMAVLFMAQPAKTAKKALGGIGMTTTQLAKDMQSGGLLKAVGDLHDHLVKAGDTGDKVGQVLVQAFGHRAGTGLSVLVDQYDRLKQKSAEVKKGAGGFQDAWKATLNNFQTKMDSVRHTIDALGIKLGLWLIPWVEKAADAFLKFTGWLDKHKQVALALAGAVGGVVVAALIAAAVAFADFVGPIALVAVAIGAAGAAVVSFVQTHKKQLLPILHEGIAIFKVVEAWVKDRLVNAWHVIEDVIRKKIIPAFESAWSTFTKKVTPALANLRSELDKHKPQLDKVGKLVDAMFKAWANVQGLIDSKVIKALGWFAGNVFAGVVDNIATLVGWVSSAVDMFDALWGKVRNVGSALANLTSGSGIVSGLEHLVGNVLNPGHHALGGTALAGGLSWVGENGPELVRLPGGSSVIPNHRAAAMAGQGDGATLVHAVLQLDGRTVYETVQRAALRDQGRNGTSGLVLA